MIFTTDQRLKSYLDTNQLNRINIVGFRRHAILWDHCGTNICQSHRASNDRRLGRKFPSGTLVLS
jgi:hypothetical protein